MQITSMFRRHAVPTVFLLATTLPVAAVTAQNDDQDQQSRQQQEQQQQQQDDQGRQSQQSDEQQGSQSSQRYAYSYTVASSDWSDVRQWLDDHGAATSDTGGFQQQSGEAYGARNGSSSTDDGYCYYDDQWAEQSGSNANGGSGYGNRRSGQSWSQGGGQWGRNDSGGRSGDSQTSDETGWHWIELNDEQHGWNRDRTQNNR